MINGKLAFIRQNAKTQKNGSIREVIASCFAVGNVTPSPILSIKYTAKNGLIFERVMWVEGLK